MKTVGIRVLKNRLSEYLRYVRRGETIVVTDRGDVVAEIVPPGRAHDGQLDPRLLEAARKGEIRLGRHHDPAVYHRPPVVRLPEGTALLLLDEDRGER